MTNKDKPNYYTQRDWDRTVGWGKVPEKYQYTHLRKKAKVMINKKEKICRT